MWCMQCVYACGVHVMCMQCALHVVHAVCICMWCACDVHVMCMQCALHVVHEVCICMWCASGVL